MTRPVDLMPPEVLARPAYAVPDASGLIKLDAMENPYAWPGELEDAWLESLRGIELNRYPDASAREVVAAIRSWHALPAAAGCLLGNGSDELIQMLITAVRASGRPVLAPVPTFVMYEVIANALGVPFIGVPLRADFDLDRDAMLRALAEHRPALVFLAFPNNPTGRLCDPGVVADLVAANPGVTVLDEAYAPFSSHSFLSQAGSPAGLMVMRTFSKLGLAGLRLGYLAAAREWTDALERLRLPYNINSVTQRTLVFARQHAVVLDRQAAALVDQREWLRARLSEQPGVLRVIPSEANFLLFQVATGRGAEVFALLRARGILIKNVGAHGGVLADHLRVTVGTEDQNRTFLDSLDAALA